MNTVLITGANRGIGLGFATFYLQAGWKVFAAARNPEATAFTELSAEFGERFTPVALDVTNAASIQAMASVIGGSGIKLDLLINNAGISEEENFGQWTADLFETSFRVNVTGPALIVQALEPCLRDGGKIVNLSSGMGSLESNVNPGNGLDAYAASKAALNILTLRLAEKLKPRSIAAITISPGWVKTDMGGAEAPATVEEAVAQMTDVIERLTLDESGLFFAENGERMPW